MNIKNGRFRKRKIYFTQVSNAAIRDNKLSLKAKGLYSIIQSYITIEDFILYKNTLRAVCSEGETAFDNTWKELKAKGYLIQYRMKSKTGTFYYEYDLLDHPDLELAQKYNNSKITTFEEELEKSEEDKNKVSENSKNDTYSGAKIDVNNDYYVDEEEKDDRNNQILEQITGNNYVENHPPRNRGMDKLGDGEVGIYNNTDLNNTDLNNTIIDRSIYKIEENTNNKDDMMMDRPIKNIMNLCSIYNFKIKPEEVKSLLYLVSEDKLKAYIIRAAATGSNIINLFSYLVTVISNEIDKINISN